MQLIMLTAILQLVVEKDLVAAVIHHVTKGRVNLNRVRPENNHTKNYKLM